MDIEKNADVGALLRKADVVFSDHGFVCTDSTWLSREVCSPFTRLYFVSGGSAVLEGESGETVKMSVGNLYLIPFGYTFSYHSDSSVTKLFFHINITRPDGYDYLSTFGKIGIMPIGKEEIDGLIEDYKNGGFDSALRLKFKVISALSELLSLYSYTCDMPYTYSDTVRRAMSYIRKNLTVKLSVGEISEHLFVSRSSLSSHFAKEVGVSLSSYIDDLIFYSAENELLHTDKTIGEISMKYGFCDQFYFSRRFKMRRGITPAKFRAAQKLK